MAIHVTFEVKPNEGRPEVLAGHAQFVNRGDATVSFVAVQVESASLALEIEDGEGSPVPLPPPPVPDPSARPFDLAPGESYEVDYPGFVPSWIEPGRYRARARLGAAESDWVALVVVA